MSPSVRPLRAEDEESVREVSASVWDDDYAPSRFLDWLENPCWHPIGVFEGQDLVAFAALDENPETKIAWVKALRVKQEHHQKGYGTIATKSLIELALQRGINYLRYATSSRNIASIGLAKKLGFELIDTVGYFRLLEPYPAHPKPSPNFVPLEIDSERVNEILIQTPSLVNTKTLPVAWNFEEKRPESIRKIGKRVEFRVMVNDRGENLAFYYYDTYVRKGEIARAHTVFSLDRAVFIDILARLIDDLKESGIARAVFFIGPRSTEWIPAMGILDEKALDRRFVLYEMKIS